MHCNRVHLGKEDHDTEIAMALKSARRAIELDPDDPWGHHALGYAYAAVAPHGSGHRGTERRPGA